MPVPDYKELMVQVEHQLEERKMQRQHSSRGSGVLRESREGRAGQFWGDKRGEACTEAVVSEWGSEGCVRALQQPHVMFWILVSFAVGSVCGKFQVDLPDRLLYLSKRFDICSRILAPVPPLKLLFGSQSFGLRNFL